MGSGITSSEALSRAKLYFFTIPKQKAPRTGVRRRLQRAESFRGKALVALPRALGNERHELLAVLRPEVDPVARLRDVGRFLQQAEELLLDLHEGRGAELHRRADFAEVHLLAVLLEVPEQAVAAGRSGEAAVGAEVERGRQFAVLAHAARPHEVAAGEFGRLARRAVRAARGGAAGEKGGAERGGKNCFDHGGKPSGVSCAARRQAAPRRENVMSASYRMEAERPALRNSRQRSS